MEESTEITMEKNGDTYKICIRFKYLNMYINDEYQGGIRVDRTDIYEWVMNIIQGWLDRPKYEDLF